MSEERGDFRSNPSNAAGEILHTRPTRSPPPRLPQIPPTQLVDCSYSAYTGEPRLPPVIPPTQLVDCSYPAYKRRTPTSFGNPTNAVGGLFILSLQRTSHDFPR